MYAATSGYHAPHSEIDWATADKAASIFQKLNSDIAFTSSQQTEESADPERRIAKNHILKL
jgi:hypothetical protein